MVEHGQETQVHCEMAIQLLIMQTACADQTLQLQEVSQGWWADGYKSCPRLFLIQAWYSRGDLREVVVVTIRPEAHGVQLAEEPPSLSDSCSRGQEEGSCCQGACWAKKRG